MASTAPTAPSIAYVVPLRIAWRRTQLLLLRPVIPRAWLVLGFAAWLAGLLEGTGGGGGHFYPGKRTGARYDLASLQRAWDHLLEHPWLAAGVVLALLIAAVVLLALLWVSSRAKFVYLAGVVSGHAAIVEPWRRPRTLGHSLFL